MAQVSTDSKLDDSPMDVAVCVQHTTVPVDEERLRSVVRAILAEAGVTLGDISLAIVDDATIHRLNRQYLDHDYPTDVLSFELERQGTRLEGEIVASGQTAQREAASHGWDAESELLLYVIHGALHLVGYDDQTAEDTKEMRRQEARWLKWKDEESKGLKSRRDEV